MRRRRTSRRLTDGGVLGGLFVVGLSVLLLVVILVPPMMVPATVPPGEGFTAANTIRTTLIQVLGGVALLIGAFFTARTFLLSRHSNRVDRFAKAAGSLGDPSRSVRTGGVLSLQHLATESADYWPLVEEMLAAFIRERARPADLSAAERLDEQRPPAADQSASDIQVALRVLGRRPGPRAGARRSAIDLRRLDLSGVDLQGANLDSARFDGSLLCGAQLSDASLTAASLTDARLERAVFASADLSDADLRGASLTDAVLYDALMAGTKVQGCDLATVQLTETQMQALDFTDYRIAAGS